MGRIGVSGYLLLLKARNSMDRDFAEPLRIDDLARSACCSPSHFIRSFKTAFGETPRGYLRRRRIERASTLLRDTDLSVTEICMATGFASLGTFSRTFKEIIGQSPTAYRRAHKDSPAIPGCFVLNWTRPVDRAVSEKPSEVEVA